jgi:hypothetical protein
MTSEATKIENQTLRLISIVYIIIGIAEVGYFVIENFAAPPHILALGILSFITAYSVFAMKKWALPLVVGLFFVGIIFGATILINSLALQTFQDAILLHLAIIAYMIVLLIVSTYVIARRENLE